MYCMFQTHSISADLLPRVIQFDLSTYFRFCYTFSYTGSYLLIPMEHLYIVPFLSFIHYSQTICFSVSYI